MLPKAEPPVTLHVADVAVPLSAALNCCVAPVARLTVAGATVRMFDPPPPVVTVNGSMFEIIDPGFCTASVLDPTVVIVIASVNFVELTKVAV
jgi:hypothetical protein